MSEEVKMVYETKGMPFRRLGSSGLRVPLLSLGACKFHLVELVKRVIHVRQGSRSEVL